MSITTTQKMIDVIKITRKLKSFSQSELASLTGISRKKINQYENGRKDISVGELITICNTLDILLTIG
jgi:transcriptional regulator with XRE-family HTH domain